MTAPATVLVIDDSTEVLAVVAARLRPEGHRVVTTEDWERGIQLALTEYPDVILLDIHLPGTSGLDVCRRLKSDPRTSEIPVIFLTASDDVTMKVHGFDLGAADYVTKPFHPAELKARVRAALRTKREHEQLGMQARHDALTALWNRGQFDRILASEVAVCSREKRPLALVMIDLDHFKAINDDHGHAFGDSVLRRVSLTLGEAVRGGDFACRYGGEELALVLPDTTAESAAMVCERIREALAAVEFRSVHGSDRVEVTASFGVADLAHVESEAVSASANAMVEAADQALYLAKRSGRDRVVVLPRRRRSESEMPYLRAL